jgi:polar amino acid transport system substrate-binding protein
MRTTALRLACVLALTCAAPAQAARDDHASAIAALADVRAAVREIVRIEDSYAVGHDTYLRAAHRAMNALVGRRDDGYAKWFGDPGDGVGTLGHIDQMLDQTGSFLWTPALEGAKANVLAASDNLQSAFGEKEMEDYQADLTRALANLALVVGRPTQDGVLGGITGALGNTVLGVPASAVAVSGCGVPPRTPAYGVVAQRLVYLALSRSVAARAIPDNLNVARIVVQGDSVVLYMRGAATSTPACHQTSRFERTRDVAVTTAEPPYTAAQARDGVTVYKKSCIQCHGADLQGTAGPAVAGSEFLTTARINKWTLNDLRVTIFQNMPFSNPGSLTPKQYAEVTAFLLASNCYPAGAKPFPQAGNASFEAVRLGPVAGANPTNKKFGTCAVQ